MTISRSTVLALAAGLVLAGCGGEDTTTSSGGTSPSTSASPHEGGPVTSSCSGTYGDGNGAELSTVELKKLGENLQVTYHLDAALETRETVLYTVDAWDMYGKNGYQLGVDFNRRGQASQYVLAYPDQTTTDVEGEPETSGTTVVATYPMSMLDSLGKKFEWSATVKIGADPADSCPSVGNDDMNPERVTFKQ